MASINQLISEIAHAVGDPNSIPLRRNIRYAIIHTRNELIQVLSSDYVLFAKSRGEKGWNLVKNHGIRNILLPAITLQFLSFSELFGGAVLVAQVFSYPGIGQTAVAAGLQSDVPLFLGIVLFSAVFVFAGNTLADIMYYFVDPRIRENENFDNN